MLLSTYTTYIKHILTVPMQFWFPRVSSIQFAAFRGHGDHERWIPHRADGKDVHGAQQWGAIAQRVLKCKFWGIYHGIPTHSGLNDYVKLIDKCAEGCTIDAAHGSCLLPSWVIGNCTWCEQPSLKPRHTGTSLVYIHGPHGYAWKWGIFLRMAIL
jgi:hypothetical protein